VDLAGLDPEAVLEALCAPIDAGTSAETATCLRHRKRKVSLLVALADLGGVWALDAVTGALTRFADFSCDSLMSALVQEAVERDRITLDGPRENYGLFALAMGKMGAHELNYSSDIDLIVLFDETRFGADKTHAVKSEFIRITRKLSQLMNAATGDGYIFRVDLRLRPDPLINPVCLSAGGAMRYYESFARTWERAAMIKARPCAGDLDAADRFLRDIEPFVWRTLLDYAAVHDASEMRELINDQKGTGGLSELYGHDLKLGQGGIRQIELFVQAFQMLAGGRDSSLRVAGTVPALHALCSAGWIQEDARNRLVECYGILRTTEHRLQMIQDSQTHSLPRQHDDMPRIAALCGHDSADGFLIELSSVLNDVHRLTSDDETGKATDESGVDDLSYLTASDHELISGWQSLPALRSDRAVDIFKRLEPMILSRMGLARNPHEALIHFDRFLHALPAGVQLFSLFEARPKLVELLTDICTTAPRLAEHLGRTSHVFDDVLYSNFFQPIEDTADLQSNLESELADARDYEATLRTTRRWLNAQKFRNGVHHLKHMITHEEVSRNYSRLAETVLARLWPRVVDEFATRHGPPPGRGATVVALGSLGARCLSAMSDLDLIVIYDPLDEAESSGAKCLPVRSYYARLT
ncbi:MAG: glutamine-synthetase adenylyltransferase, partial [Rhodobacteraceae bacterium]|nr:glutamine-synthetase adenylyltransferase [Paracoccaceae bacterium]